MRFNLGFKGLKSLSPPKKKPLISVLRYNYVILKAPHPDTLYLHEQECEWAWLFFEAKWGLWKKKILEKCCLRILYFCLLLGCANDPFPWALPTKTLYAPLLTPIITTCPSILTLLSFIMKLSIMQSSLFPVIFSLLEPNNHLLHINFEYFQLVAFLKCMWATFTPV